MSLLAFRFLLFYLLILIVQPQNRFTFLHPLHIADITFIGAVCCHGAAFVVQGTPLIRFGVGTKLAVALLFLGCMSLFFGPLSETVSWNPWIDILVKNSAVLILLEAMATSIERIWAIFATLMLGALWWIKAGIRLSQAGATYAGDRLMGAAVSLIENPNTYAYLLCSMIPIYLYFAFRSKSVYIRLLFILLSLSGVYIVFETGSRTGFLILLVIAFFIALKFWKKNRKELIIGALGVSVILGSLVSAGNIARFRTIRKSIDSFLAGEIKGRGELTQDMQSAQERRLKNRDTWRLILEYPFFGVGINADQEKYIARFPYAGGQVHNEILAAGRQMGFIGMAVYAGFIYILIVNGWRIERRCKWWPDISDMGWMIKVVGIVFLVGGFFSPLPWNAIHLTFCAGLSALLSYLREHDPDALKVSSG